MPSTTRSSLPNFELKSPNRIFILHFEKWLKTCSNFLQKLSFESSLLSFGACTFKTMILHQQRLRTIYVILSLTNSSLLTANTTLWCTKNLFPIDDFRFLFCRTKYKPPSSHLTSCTPTQTNLHLPHSLVTVINEPGLYRLLSFHVPNLTSLVH